MAGRRGQDRLFEYLQQCERKGVQFTKEQLIEAVGWQQSTFKTYSNKGQLSQFVVNASTSTEKLEAVNTLDINLIEFKKRLSQSKHFQELGHKCKSPLAKALLKKSKDNMMLAMELYNRPSLENKLDGFVLLFCTAWEQLLKSILIERDGENSIYDKAGKQGIKRTITLRKCLDLLFDEKNQVRKNIELVTNWRDQAVHLLMPELQSLASRVFQSGVLNYSGEFEKFSEVSFISSQHTGMMSLVGDFKIPPASMLKTLYGKAADEILELATTLQADIDKNDDINFAIPLRVSLVFAKEEGDEQIVIAKANGSAEDLKNLRQAMIVEKHVTPDKTHPYSQNKLRIEVNERLYRDFDLDRLNKKLPKRNRNGEPELNKHCIQACINKLGWKFNNNDFHYHSKLSNRHQYSEAAVNELVKKIEKDDDFVSKAKSAKS
ncbi:MULTISPECIES: DUF3644 domain-containing protein [Shewanella]|jgi:hypothetical protein|uniref:DUF3644 domain-containing protein n=1 Tax=Shewanella TaxID=22 RepID=UPI001ECCA9E2|nr:DUF3644 domain-containing protein [Shewanella sp.]MBZ4677523.1 hypothetical protein [Shewanella sp.]